LEAVLTTVPADVQLPAEAASAVVWDVPHLAAAALAAVQDALPVRVPAVAEAPVVAVPADGADGWVGI